MARLIIEQGGKSVKQGLEVSIHWSGWTSGYSKYTTQPSGITIIPDDDLRGNSRKADKIFVENPKGGSSVKFENVNIRKGEDVYLDLNHPS